MTLKNEIELVLQEIPESRNSDIALMIEVWRRFYGDKIRISDSGGEYINLKVLYELPREDNIKRVRAAFNAEGRYWPTDLKVARGRGILEDEWRVKLGYPKRADTVSPTKEPSYTEQVAPEISAEPDDRQSPLLDLPPVKSGFRTD